MSNNYRPPKMQPPDRDAWEDYAPHRRSAKEKADSMTALIKLLEDGKINNNIAKSTLDKMLQTGKTPDELIDLSSLGGVDESELRSICEQVIAGNEKAVSDIKGGKTAAMGALIGGVMKATKGSADAKLAQKILRELLGV